MRAIDRNVLVRLVTRDDPSQAAAADRFIAQGAWVSLLALAEATWVLSTVYERTPAEQILNVEMLLDHKELTLEDEDVVRAAVELFRTRPSLGFSDCLMLQVARKAGHLPLGTFDKGLSRIEGTQRV
jgi:predicted nucleic-acid-binding protein